MDTKHCGATVSQPSQTSLSSKDETMQRMKQKSGTKGRKRKRDSLDDEKSDGNDPDSSSSDSESERTTGGQTGATVFAPQTRSNALRSSVTVNATAAAKPGLANGTAALEASKAARKAAQPKQQQTSSPMQLDEPDARDSKEQADNKKEKDKESKKEKEKEKSKESQQEKAKKASKSKKDKESKKEKEKVKGSEGPKNKKQRTENIKAAVPPLIEPVLVQEDAFAQHSGSSSSSGSNSNSNSNSNSAPAPLSTRSARSGSGLGLGAGLQDLDQLSQEQEQQPEGEQKARSDGKRQTSKGRDSKSNSTNKNSSDSAKPGTRGVSDSKFLEVQEGLIQDIGFIMSVVTRGRCSPADLALLSSITELTLDFHLKKRYTDFQIAPVRMTYLLSYARRQRKNYRTGIHSRLRDLLKEHAATLMRADPYPSRENVFKDKLWKTTLCGKGKEVFQPSLQHTKKYGIKLSPKSSVSLDLFVMKAIQYLLAEKQAGRLEKTLSTRQSETLHSLDVQTTFAIYKDLGSFFPDEAFKLFEQFDHEQYSGKGEDADLIQDPDSADAWDTLAAEVEAALPRPRIPLELTANA